MDSEARRLSLAATPAAPLDAKMRTKYSTASAFLCDLYVDVYLDALFPPQPTSTTLWRIIYPHGRPLPILPGAALWRVRRGIARQGAHR